MVRTNHLASPKSSSLPAKGIFWEDSHLPDGSLNLQAGTGPTAENPEGSLAAFISSASEGGSIHPGIKEGTEPLLLWSKRPKPSILSSVVLRKLYHGT